MPKVFSMVCTVAFGPAEKAALILFCADSCEFEGSPVMVTKVSRGIDRVEAVPAAGSTWMILRVSDRAPVTPWGDPNCWASAAVSPWRLSEPMRRTL